jgi:glutaminyl-peptide cyclotransferase
MFSNPAIQRKAKRPSNRSWSNLRSRRFGMTLVLAMLSVLCLMVLIGAVAWTKYTNSTAGAKLPPSPFNEQRAFEDLERFAALGPRPLGSEAHDWTYLLIHLSLLGAGVDVHNVEFDSFKASTPVGEIEMTNVIAKIPGARPEMVILGGHYDTKRMKMRFVGANDGASSTAFLIEMAHVLAQRRNRFTYWIVLFDGQEALKDWSASDGLYGSRHFAQSLSADQVKQIRAMFNVDMIGDRNLHIHRESHSDSQLTDLIFRDAQDLGYGRYFLERPLSVEDDHMPFVRAGIPAVELISLDYGPFNIFWHTPFDTVGKCSAVSLGIVGRVLLDALEDIESGRTPKPLLAFLECGAAGRFQESSFVPPSRLALVTYIVANPKHQ